MNTAMLLHNGPGYGPPHWHGGWGGGPPWLGILTVLLFAAVVGVGIYLARRRPASAVAHPGPGQAQASSAEQVLAERFARGDVTEEEYVARLSVLRENRRE